MLASKTLSKLVACQQALDATCAEAAARSPSPAPRERLGGDVPLQAHIHQANGCFLPKGGGVEGTPSTDKEFLALYLLPLGLIR